MKKTFKQALAVLLTVVMLFSVMSVAITSSAEDTEYLQLVLDQDTEANISEEGESCYLTFTPSTSGLYVFTSASECDTKAYLYSSEMEKLAYNDDGGEASNFAIVYNLTAGVEYILEVSFYYDDVGSIPVTVFKGPDIKNVTIEPVNMVENIGGQWTEDYDDETGSYSDEYFRYSWWDEIEYTIELNDGTSLEDKGVYFYYEDVEYTFEYFPEAQRFENAWKSGNTYTDTVSLGGKEYPVEITIAEFPIEKIEMNPVSVMENVDGAIEQDYNDETGEYDLEYFRYYWWNELSYTVTMKDGTEFEESGDYFEYDGIDYSFNFDDPQSYADAWTAGNTYTAPVRIADQELEVKVTVAKFPIKSIEFKPIEIVELTEGYFDSDYNEETGEYDLEYYYYDWKDLAEYKVVTLDGTVIEGSGRYFEYDGEEYWFEYDDSQSYDNAWKKDNTYTVAVNLGNVKADVKVSILETPIKSITFDPITMSEGANGYWEREYDGETDEYGPYYFVYYLRDELSYTVTMKDGTTVKSKEDGFVYNGVTYGINGEFYQDYQNRFEAGKTYTVTLGVADVTSDVKITITPSPIASIKAEPLKMSEYNGGYFDYGYNEETEDYDLEYFEYEWYDNISYTITMKDGTVIKEDGWGFEYDDEYYTMKAETYQGYDNRFEPGNTYTETFGFGGCEAKVKITLVENPIKKVEFDPLTLAAYVDGDWINGYNYETDEFDIEYFRYEWWDRLAYTVTMKNGSVVKAKGDSFVYDGVEYELLYETYEQDQYNQWTPDETYTVSVGIANFEDEVEVTVAREALAKVDGVWKLYKDGVWQKQVDTLHWLAGKWFLIKGGIWKPVTGLEEYKGKIFYVSGGKWDKTITDLKKVDGKWYYIQYGKWNQNIDTLHKINGKWFLIKKGMWNKTTGIVEYKNKDFYVVGGKWKSQETLYKKNGKYLAIKGGKWFKDKGIVKYNGKKYYVNKGYAQTSYSGKVTINGKKYTVKKGIIK